MTALDVASILKISTVIVPLYPGITSALGLLTTDLKYDFVKTDTFDRLGRLCQLIWPPICGALLAEAQRATGSRRHRRRAKTFRVRRRRALCWPGI